MNKITTDELTTMLSKSKRNHESKPIIIFPKHAHRDEIEQLKMFLEDEQWDAYEVTND